jgi:hypothetical protein
MIGIPTIADAILDRLVHNAFRIELSGAACASLPQHDARETLRKPNLPAQQRARGRQSGQGGISRCRPSQTTGHTGPYHGGSAD